MSLEEKAIKSTYLSVFGNAALALVKGITGYLGNSYALIADAIESVSDVFSSILVLFGIKYASRPADKNHPYGHGRAEPLVTFLVVGFLVSSAVIIAYQSIQNIRTPHDPPKAYTLIVLGLIIGIKEVFYRIVKLRGEETHSSAITSLAAFIGISIALYMGSGYEAADDWAALLASGIILYNSYLIFRPALGEIMDEQLDEGLIQRIRELSKEVPGVIGTEKCMIRKTGMKYHVDLHIIVNADISVREGHLIAHALKDHLRKVLVQLADVLIHVEPDN